MKAFTSRSSPTKWPHVMSEWSRCSCAEFTHWERGRVGRWAAPANRQGCFYGLASFRAADRLAILERCRPQLHLTIYSASTSEREGEALQSEHHWRWSSLEFTAFTFSSFILDLLAVLHFLLAQLLLFLLFSCPFMPFYILGNSCNTLRSATLLRTINLFF